MPTKTKPLIYFPSQNLSIDPVTGEIYTEDQIDYFDKLRKNWQESQRVFSFFELVNIYGPECYPTIITKLKEKLNEAKIELEHYLAAREVFIQTFINPAPYEQRLLLENWSEITHLKYINLAEKKIKQYNYRLAFLKKLQQRHKTIKQGKALPLEDSHHITEADIEAAKNVPIETLHGGKLIKMGDRYKGLCLFHQEKTPSFIIYKRRNTWHCYGCHAGRDAPDFVMRQQNVEFLEAVKILLNQI